MNTTISAVLASVLVSVAVSSVRADQPVASLKTTPVAVSLFKNGLGYVAREGALPKGDAGAIIEGLPAAVHGTLWVYARGEDATITDLVAFERDSIQPVPAVTLAELVEANVGETIDARLTGDKVVRGTIVAVPANRPASPPIMPMRPTLYPTALNPTAIATGETATLVLLQTDSGMVALNKSSIEQITRVGGPLKTSVGRTTRTPALALRATNPRGDGRVAIHYLARGISWAPSYVVDISEPTIARITAKAEIVNEIEDLSNAAVKFITGYPNLQFADVTDPMALREDLGAFLNSLLNPPAAGQIRARRGVVVQQSGGQVYGDALPLFPTAALQGQASEDLFFYEQRGVTLRKGERGYYTLLTAAVPYEHVYEWKIADTLDEQERQRAADPNEPTRTEEVWHGVRLTNAGGAPWTTAPALTVQGGQALGQDVLYYTSVGGKTVVKITQAVDIKPERTELEVDRKRNAASFYGSSYSLLTVRGQLAIVNFKNADVTLSITKDLSGEVITASPSAKVAQLAKGLRRANPHTQLSWDLPIKARGKAEVEYTYKVYVRE
jgi:hypothetical protein